VKAKIVAGRSRCGKRCAERIASNDGGAGVSAMGAQEQAKRAAQAPATLAN